MFAALVRKIFTLVYNLSKHTFSFLLLAQKTENDMKKTIVFLLLIAFVWACTEEDLIVSVGENFIKSQTTVALIDTISVQLSTFKIDSISTSGTGYALVGAYSDSEFGTIASTAYLQMGMPDEEPDEDEIFDSLLISLPYSGLCYGDTLQYQTIEVYRVIQDIETAEGESYLYNSSQFAFESSPIGSVRVKPRPNFYDQLEFRLSDELGRELMALLYDEEDEINSNEDFMDNFKGLALCAGNENNMLLSFVADSSLKLTLHTHRVDEEKIEKTYSFAHFSTGLQFNKISGEYSGMALGKLGTQRSNISSAELDDKAYLQGGVGVVTRVDFNGISKILEEERANILYKAELILKPYPGSYKNIAPPQYLTLYSTDKYNNLVAEVTDDDGELIYASFSYDEFYDEDNYYLFDVTDYVYNELSDGYVDPDNGLLIMMEGNDFQGTANRVVFDARKSSKYRPELKLYYVFYN